MSDWVRRKYSGPIFSHPPSKDRPDCSNHTAAPYSRQRLSEGCGSGGAPVGIAIGEFKRDGLSQSDLFAVTIYSNNRDYTRVSARYASLRPALEKMPAAIRTDSVSADDIAVGLMIGIAVVYAACKAGDSAVAVEPAAIDH